MLVRLCVVSSIAQASHKASKGKHVPASRVAHATMRRIRQLPAAIVHHAPRTRHASATAFDDLGDNFDFDEHPVPGELPLAARPRYDWRTRAPSRRRPGGLIDPIDGTKVYYPRRCRPLAQALVAGEPWHTELENYKHRCVPARPPACHLTPRL